MTTPPPWIDIGQDDGASDAGGEEPSDAGGGEPSDAGGADDAGSGDGRSEAAPDIPAPDPADFPGMDEQTPEGAEQAVRFYFANVFFGYQTGDTSVLDGLYVDECEACGGFRDRIEGQGDGRYWSEVTLQDSGVTSQESENFDTEVGYMFTVSAHTEPVDGGGERQDVGPIEYISGCLLYTSPSPRD